MYLSAFWELSTHRVVSMGFGAMMYGEVPVNAIREYGERTIGLRGESLRLFVYLERQIDAEFLAWQRAEMERLRNQPPPAPAPRPPAARKGERMRKRDKAPPRGGGGGGGAGPAPAAASASLAATEGDGEQGST